MNDRYRWVGPAYDALAWFFSLNAIHRCRTAMTTSLASEARVLFAGVGHGSDAASALSTGAAVTVVDASATMLERCRTNCAGYERLRVVHSDVLAFEEPQAFDVVFANFFLNVFAAADVDVVAARLCSQVSSGGRLVIGDFRRPQGHALLWLLLQAHWYCAVWFFALIAGNAVHAVHDYPELMAKHGFVVVERRGFSVLGLELYEAFAFERAPP